MVKINSSIPLQQNQAISSSFLRKSEKHQEIESHLAWHGVLSGMKCEELLRGKPNGSYVFRHGEDPNSYYISWVEDTEQCSFRHQPFSISVENNEQKWKYRNGYDKLSERLDDLIPIMMHRSKEGCFSVPHGVRY